MSHGSYGTKLDPLTKKSWDIPTLTFTMAIRFKNPTTVSGIVEPPDPRHLQNAKDPVVVAADGMAKQGLSEVTITLPETNIAPKNGGFQ